MGSNNNLNPYSALSLDAQNAIKVLRDLKHTKLNDKICGAIKTLWNEPKIKEIYELRATLNLEDTSAYFWNKIDDIMQPQYVPNERDILMLRYRTTGVIP